MSIFGDALGTIVGEIHRAEGSPTITYTPLGGVALALVAVFDAPGSVVDITTGVMQRTVEPRLGVVLADFAAEPKVGDGVVVSGVAYKVADVDPDGQGGASLILRKV